MAVLRGSTHPGSQGLATPPKTGGGANAPFTYPPAAGGTSERSEQGGGCSARAKVFLTLLTVALTGCGNQMLRQPSFSPQDIPRAQPPSASVAVATGDIPAGDRATISPAYGALESAPVAGLVSSFNTREPDLPPPNLSDNARYEPAPAAVDKLTDPLPNDPRLVRSGHILFLNRCVQCHNPGGYGYGTVGQYLIPHPPDLASPLVQKISDGAMFWHITMGQGKMPGFRHWTTAAERWTLTQYVRSLKGAALDANRAGPGAWTETRTAPYPAYGVTGYEDGKSAYPFKVLHPAGDADSRANVQAQGFGQKPPSPPLGQ